MALTVCWVRGTDGIPKRSKLPTSKVMKEAIQVPIEVKSQSRKKHQEFVEFSKA